jgi:hypothetical protein
MHAQKDARCEALALRRGGYHGRRSACRPLCPSNGTFLRSQPGVHLQRGDDAQKRAGAPAPGARLDAGAGRDHQTFSVIATLSRVCAHKIIRPISPVSVSDATAHAKNRLFKPSIHRAVDHLKRAPVRRTDRLTAARNPRARYPPRTRAAIASSGNAGRTRPVAPASGRPAASALSTASSVASAVAAKSPSSASFVSI